MPFIRELQRNNKVYLYLVKSQRDGNKIRQVNLKYLGEKEKFYRKLQEGTFSLNEILSLSSKDYGDIIFIYKILQKLKIIEIIDARIQKTPEAGVSVGLFVAILIMNRLLAPSSKVAVQDWYERTVLSKLVHLPAAQVHVQAICRAMDYLTDNCIKQIESDLMAHLIQLYQIELDTLFYDITSTYFEGKKCALAFFGYSRDHRKDRRQIVIGLVIARKTRFPLMHWVFPGNTVDWNTMELVVNQLNQEANLTHFAIVTDRGMLQKTLRLQLAKQGLKFITGVKSSEKIAKELIEQVSDAQFISFQARSGELFKYYLQRYEEDGILFQVLLIFSPKMRGLQEQTLVAKIAAARTNLEQLQEELKTRKKDPELMEKKIHASVKSCKKYFQITSTLNEQGYWELTFQFQEIAFEETRAKFGKYVLLSNILDLSAGEIIQAYFDKWEVEDAFKFLKTALDLRPIYHWKDPRVKAHVFICILAYLVRTIIEHELVQLALPHSFSQVRSLLSEIKLITLKAHKKVEDKLTAIPPPAQKLLNAFNVELI